MNNISLTHDFFSVQADRRRTIRPTFPAPSPSHFSLLPSQQVRWGRLQQSLKSRNSGIRVKASNLNIGAGNYEEGNSLNPSPSSNQIGPIKGVNYPLCIAGILAISGIIFSIIVSLKGGPSTVISALSKSGFTAAFTLIFVSEIGDKTFFIAALLAMQYKRALVLIGSMGALSLMTILSVVIGRFFHSVPSQFQTTLPIGEFAAVALLTFFGLKSIKDSLEIKDSKNNSENKESGNNNEQQLGEFVEAEELVREKAAKKLTNPLEILWESFSLIFFAEWGDRSMLATIALGAAQSPIGVASGAIAGHFIATSIAILGGAFLANYISEKLVGFIGGVLFLVFAAATLFGVF